MVSSSAGIALFNSRGAFGLIGSWKALAPLTLSASQALTPGHRYVWYVAAVSTNGQAVVWSNGLSFTIAALTAPLLTAPTGTITTVDGLFMTLILLTLSGVFFLNVYWELRDRGALAFLHKKKEAVSAAPSKAAAPAPAAPAKVVAKAPPELKDRPKESEG